YGWPGDVVRISAAGVPPFVMIYVGERSFPDEAKRAFNEKKRTRPHSFFIYPWHGRLECNTFPPRLLANVSNQVSMKLAKPHNLVLVEDPVVEVSNPQNPANGNWFWYAAPSGQVTKSMFVPTRAWTGTVQIERFRRKDFPELVFLKRPHHLHCVKQLNNV